jgi:hypothetical protein
MKTNPTDLATAAQEFFAVRRSLCSRPAIPAFLSLRNQSPPREVNLDLASRCRHRTSVAAAYRGESAGAKISGSTTNRTNEGCSGRKGGLR